MFTTSFRVAFWFAKLPV